MTNIAILGFGVVGSGVADLIVKNNEEVVNFGGDEINIKYILDLRDFPDSPFADRIVHDFNVILNDPTVSTVIEVMGGSHPAYEFTVAALNAKKSVITSNKEVVANFADEFLRLAVKNSVCYRFEAAVGGGIPVISPIIECIRQNKIREVRGILNGTTNYILTKMFSFGESFKAALSDAQAKGYAERNPDADILGIDAARKITILSALVTEKLLSPDDIHTEGITEIRLADVTAAEKIGCKIKLLGRCINDGDAPYVMVAPFMLSGDSALADVSGVYNAVEVVAEPLGNVMFYGRGAGAGPTASAVVGDLMQIMRHGETRGPEVERSSAIAPFDSFSCRRYFAFERSAAETVKATFGDVDFIDSDECAFITPVMSESEAREKKKSATASGFAPLSHIRVL
ncbi:MAG: homoserine dehydrogenase [Clostridia bacterium]|nr:homoserine dehydrogenase [Clostridia bacterium]